MKKKIVLITLCAILCIGIAGSTFAANSLSDVSGTKYEEAVAYLVNEGILNGFEDGTYKPENNVTRAQLSKILCEALKLEEAQEDVTFSDVKGHWAESYIKTASKNKIINGYEDGTFKPESNVTYAEAVTMVIRAMGEEVNASTSGKWYENYMAKAKEKNLLNNITNVSEEQDLNRGNTAILTYNMLKDNGNNVSEEKSGYKVEDFHANVYGYGYGGTMGISYQFFLKDSEGKYILDNDGYFKCLSINNPEDYNLPDCLLKFCKDDVLFRITYSEEDLTVYDCKIVDSATKTVIEDLSEENLNRLYNVEYGKEVIEKEWTDEINLSELEENTVYKYKYTKDDMGMVPTINNDLNKNCIIYTEREKETFGDDYNSEINMYNTIKATSLSISAIKKDCYFNIIYKTINDDELFKYIDEDDIIYLSKYNNGDELDDSFKKYLYNDTSYDIKLHIENNFFGIEETKDYTIEAGKIYRYDSGSIDLAKIEY